ncbi:glycine-rich domain-containing protein 1-like [Silene latifolia]|uniref:glycine-rich domain-containing protein 1-like n=1 Tax=Silene latifolia TaxID=37657 RepID=UPI003D776AC3
MCSSQTINIISLKKKKRGVKFYCELLSMEKMQKKEWAEAQKIVVSVDLVEAAKKQLKFLAAVDRNRYLHEEDHALKWAIYRYNACWLPLLAKHLENPVSEDPLVVPLDCEWIWHCHRLSPIRYKVDCQKLYGTILGNRNVISSVQATSKNATEEIWNKLYPDEPYELDINRPFSEDIIKNHPDNNKFTSYDLVAAVKRQSSFTFQVSRPYMSDDLFLQEAEARYKGFLHLIRTNSEMGINRFCVPTYDVDLMWHTHQLYPGCYCKDLIKLTGRVLQHDDTDSDRTKGGKLDTGFSETTKQFEETFGKRYWKAGTLSKGSSPTPVTHVPSEFNYEAKEINAMKLFDRPMQLSARQAVEVFLEFVEIRNLPEVYNDNLVVSFSKKQTDKLFDIKRSLSIFSESGEKQVAYFQCEPTGEFLIELESQSPSDELKSNSSKVFGSCCLSLQELVSSPSQLSADKWLSVDLVSDLDISEPVLLHVAVSFTPPTPAPQVFHLDSTQHALPSILNTGNVNRTKTQTYVTDDDGNEVFSLQMRNIGNNTRKCAPELLKEVHLITVSGEKLVAEFLDNNWFINGMGLFNVQNNRGNDDHLFELVGSKTVKLFRGRRLDFEPKYSGNQRCEQDFITFVEFSVDHPYGKAIALFDLKLGTVKAVDEWIVVPGIIIGFILAEAIVDESNGEMGTAACGSCDAKGVLDVCGEEKMAKCGGGNCASGGCHSGRCSGCGGGKCGSKVDSSVYSSACGGGKCGGGKCGDEEKMVRCGGGKCSGGCAGGKCGGGKCGGEEKMAKCGGGKCSGGCAGGKCGGGKCGGEEKMAKCGGGKCSGSCGAEEKMAKCGGGKCSGSCGAEEKMAKCGGGKCSGSCGAEEKMAKCGGGKCSGSCGGGKCGEEEKMANCGGGKCSGKVDSSIYSSACGGGKCGSGKCGGGKWGGMVEVSIYSSACGGGKCGSGKCGGGKCGGYGLEDYTGGNDMPKVASSIMNEPLAA